MAEFDIDTRKLSQFQRELDDLARMFPKQARRLMQLTGSKARTIVARKAKQLVRKHTGNYLKSIKRGKVWVERETGHFKVRVYSRSPHSHLIEYGHRIVDRHGNEHGFKEGVHVFGNATKEIDDQWSDLIEEQFDKIMSKL